MKLSDISIRNPVFAWMLMAATLLFGALGFWRLGISFLPDVDTPYISISLTWEGAAPEIMESDVVDVVEDAMTLVDGVKEISSSTRRGSARVTIEFELSRDIDVAFQDVQARLSQAQRHLPRDMDPPEISKSNPEDQPIMFLGLSGDRPLKELLNYAEDTLKDRFQTIPGVAEIFLGGFVERNLRVWVDTEKLSRYELTVEDILTAIGREHAEIPAGQLETSVKEYGVRVYGEALTADEFEKILITRRGGEIIYAPIPLREVARVENGLADVRRSARVMGERSTGLGIRKQRGSNAVEVARRVRERLEEMQKSLPAGMKLRLNFDTTRFIEESVRELEFNLLLSALLTSLVCWVFLGSWSSTINVLLAIPTAVFGTFFILHLAGFTLNTFTILGLGLAIGIVVDDAIMVLENIVRHREWGEPRMQAAVIGAREITFAAVAATVAILAIFVPVIFMGGIMGRYFFQFGVTISVAVLFSLLEALTLAPMRCSQFLEVGHGGRFVQRVDKAFRSSAALYRRVLGWALCWRWVVIGIAVMLFGGSLVFIPLLRKEFVPAQDQSVIIARAQAAIGSSLEFTDGRFREMEAIIQAHPGVKHYFASVGGFGGGDVSSGMAFITLKPPADRPRRNDGRRMTHTDIMSDLRESLKSVKGLRVILQDPSQSGIGGTMRGFPVEFTVRGPDWDKLVELSGTMRKELEATGLVTDVDTDFKTGMPEIQVIPDRARAFERGVSMESIGIVVQSMVGGIRAGRFSEGGRRYDVRVRTEAKDRPSPRSIANYYVRNNRSELVRLSDVVRIEEKPTLLSITRRGRERAIGITANMAAGVSQQAVLRTIENLGGKILPEQYHVVMAGSAQTFRESFQGLLFALSFGIAVAYMVLASQFNSFVHPFTVLLALPFCVTGALTALWLADKSINIYSMIGILLLMGIAKKNSILLVDFTNQRRREGKGVREALLEACPIRLRPILMTSVSTIAAALPPALAFGPGAEARIPMAIVVIGGVLVSTLLTLLVVPCAYSLFARMEGAKREEIPETTGN
ncbi:MAG: efflux RND transporter permease subunit [Planctomycetota bacterium]